MLKKLVFLYNLTRSHTSIPGNHLLLTPPRMKDTGQCNIKVFYKMYKQLTNAL